MNARCIELVRKHRPIVTVVGDFMLDGWWSGRIERFAREAPAPVVDIEARRDAPGGAANTALNLAALGARVRAVGAVGADAAASRLLARLGEAGVDVTRLREVPGAQTTTKVRVSVGDEMLMRLDRTQTDTWPGAARRRLVNDVAAAAGTSDALLICDYGSSLLDDETVAALAGLRRPPLLVVDAHDPRRWRALHPDVVTPNAAEAERVQGAELGEGSERVGNVDADELFAETGATAIVVTLDRTGTVLLRRNRLPHRTYARPAPEHQASGAGDVFAAALTTARAAGMPLEHAADFAQRAADVAVRKSGTCVCSLEELEEPEVSADTGRGDEASDDRDAPGPSRNTTGAARAAGDPSRNEHRAARAAGAVIP
ncbi:bifunctional heptose 7-phosphate kinase/heptose 1-phosphate adenyltransferase [Leucobacter ruminantium]|uniref:Bifunctional hydroxymethylpyrimidine kinase/phosphomethylpyrimidine kinase n=1 Tax=Leucobacter ruminantium TaxID=1289170 RepID=A0A939RVU1_9MICO|nr:PfkB family carbohydrate kinase [Leucobacter ruminantium]MBO1804307.1 bifunctional hydroxymethylpyrimidine kinase/phosphomethylpyrimidine kinase [Leucobacter ruminantium]